MKKLLLLLVLYLIVVNVSNAQDINTKEMKQLYKAHLSGRKYPNNYDYYSIIRLKEETGKFPNLKLSSSLKNKIYELYNMYMNEKYLLSEITPKKYEKIVDLYSQLLACNEYDLDSYLKVTEFYNKMYKVSKDEKYLKELIPLYSKMKTNFAGKVDSDNRGKFCFHDEVYQQIIVNYFKIRKYEECYNQCIEYQKTQTDFFIPRIENNQCPNLHNLLLIPILEYYLGNVNDSFSDIEKIRTQLDLQNINAQLDLGFNYVYRVILFRKQNILAYNNSVFHNYRYLHQDFFEKKIDFVNSTDLLPINNLSAKITYLKTSNSNSNDLNHLFESFLKDGTNDERVLWPVFAALNLKNTPNLMSFLNDERDIKLLLELGYLENIIDVENVDGKTKVYFLSDFNQRIIGIFELPNSTEGYKNIPISYYRFEYTLLDCDAVEFSLFTRTLEIRQINIGQGITNLTYTKIDGSLLASLNLPSTLKCDQIVELKRKEEQVKRDIENARIAEQKRQEELRIASENSNNVSQSNTNSLQGTNNDISQYREYIKTELYRLFGIKAMFGESEYDKQSNLFGASLEAKLNRKLNPNDWKYIETILKEMTAEQELLNRANKKAESTVLVCIWCNSKYIAKNGWVVDNDCDIDSQEYRFGAYGYTNGFCNQKHASEWLCVNKGCRCH